MASGLEELKVGFVAFSTMGKIFANHHINDETELEMTWSGFARRFEKKYRRRMKICDCQFIGFSSTVRKSTIRTTKQRKNLALVMQMDTGKFVVAVSKAQGCDEPIGLDAKFLGWARDYDAPFYGETWQQLDSDVDKHLLEVRGEDLESDEDDVYEVDETESSEQFLDRHYQWKPITMRPCFVIKPDQEKGEWSNAYTTPDETFIMIKKGVKWCIDGSLKTWNPPKAKESKQDKPQVELHWMWFNGNALHYCDQDNQEYSIVFGELVCRRHERAETKEEPIWMDTKENIGMLDPYNGRWYPTCLNEHIAGRNCYTLTVGNLTSPTEEDRIEWRNCHDIQQSLIPSFPDKLDITWKQGRWDCSLSVDKFNGKARRFWAISHAAFSSSDANYPEAHVALNCQNGRTWLWFYINEPENGHKVWWKCPCQITDVIIKHIRGPKKRVHLAALVNEVLDLKEIGDEYERIKRKALGNPRDPELDNLCWICGNRKFNNHNQLIDHIEGNQVEGGKPHKRMKARWEAAGWPGVVKWLETFEEVQASSETAESDDQAFSEADNGSSFQNRYAGSHQDWQDHQDWYATWQWATWSAQQGWR